MNICWRNSNWCGLPFFLLAKRSLSFAIIWNTLFNYPQKANPCRRVMNTQGACQRRNWPPKQSTQRKKSTWSKQSISPYARKASLVSGAGQDSKWGKLYGRLWWLDIKFFPPFRSTAAVSYSLGSWYWCPFFRYVGPFGLHIMCEFFCYFLQLYIAQAAKSPRLAELTKKVVSNSLGLVILLLG